MSEAWIECFSKINVEEMGGGGVVKVVEHVRCGFSMMGVG